MINSVIVSILFAATSVHCHFQMTRPAPRNVGTDDEQKIFPCAGVDTPSAKRIPISALNGSIELSFDWEGNNDVYLGFGPNPTVFPYKIGYLPGAQSGQTYDVSLNLDYVPKSAWTSEVATIQVICRQPQFDIYQCVDVSNDYLKVSAAKPSPPTTAVPSKPPSTQPATAPRAPSNSTSPIDAILSIISSGGIGSSVTPVFAIFLLAVQLLV